MTATVVAMFALSWQLTLFSLILLPFFVWLTRRVGNERRRIQSVRQSRLADMSTLVEESLSVSGILLGKTMGRSHELVERFTVESSELADLEVRARMAGRWRMSSVQMSFAIMPAAVYWFAGYTIANGHALISIGTVVAFTTLQTRLLFPMQQLLSVGLEVQTSLALFGRIFEYLDLPVDIVERPGARALQDVRGDVSIADVWFRYAARVAVDAAGDQRRDTGGHAHGARRRDGLGEDDVRLSGGAPVRAAAGGGEDRRRRHPRHDARLAGGDASGSSPRRPTCSTPRSARTCASPARRRATRRSKRRRAPRRSTS